MQLVQLRFTDPGWDGEHLVECWQPVCCWSIRGRATALRESSGSNGADFPDKGGGSGTNPHVLCGRGLTHPMISTSLISQGQTT